MIGIDIESVSRFENLYLHKKRLLEKMFNPSEWNYAVKKANPSQTLTGIWCAKEAVLKALYSYEPLFIKDITIMHKDTGQPFVLLNSELVQSASIKISISHTNEYATAVAILSK